MYFVCFHRSEQRMRVRKDHTHTFQLICRESVNKLMLRTKHILFYCSAPPPLPLSKIPGIEGLCETPNARLVPVFDIILSIR